MVLGALLVRRDRDGSIRAGRIVEVEAYIGEHDRASHARFGHTDRNAVMYGPAGIAYVYLVYGMHRCLNVVTEPEGRPAALLVRAVEPLFGIDAMRAARLARVREARRSRDPARDAADRTRILALPATAVARGPGLVGAAFSVDVGETGLDLCDPTGPLRLAVGDAAEVPTGPTGAGAIVCGPRVGIAFAGEPWESVPWRFALATSPAVSRPPVAPAGPRTGTA